MDYGFIKVAAATPPVRVADCTYNTEQMERMMRKASEQGVQIIVFPELAVTAYTCLDLFTTQTLPDEAERALLDLIRNTKDLNMLTFAGVPLRTGDVLINACVAFQNGDILGVVPKTYLPNYGEFQEKRWFTSAREIKDDTLVIGNAKYPVSPYLLFSCGTVRIGAEIGEEFRMPSPPGAYLAMAGAHIIINPSAGSELAGKHAWRKQSVSRQSACCVAGYVHAACGYGESTTDMVFAGGSLIAENGKILAEADRFSMEGTLTVSEIDVDSLRHDRRLNTCFTEGLKDFDEKRTVFIPFVLPEPDKGFTLTREIDPHPFIPTGNLLDERCEDIIRIQMAGLAKRIEHTCSKTAVIGISGGLDSTLSLLVTAMTFDTLKISRKQITGITMPGFGTTGRTYGNATALMESLGITSREISIKEATLLHFKDIGHNPDIHDVTYENAQARERTQLLMDISNREGGMVIGTGDLSELALGWTTYNGDHISMYGVNAGIPKTLVKCLVKWIAEHKVDETSCRILLDIADTPISPELIPAGGNGEIRQKTEDLVGPYELHDFYLYHFLRRGASPAKIYRLAQQAFAGIYGNDDIRKWLRTFFHRFFQQQFKRSCLPDGPKIGSVGLSPRSDWHMPSDAVPALWLREIEELDSSHSQDTDHVK